MSLEPGSGRRSISPESSGRDSPLPRQWRNQLGAEETPTKDKHYRKYASGVDRALALFETALEEWADYISFLNRLLKALQARHASISSIPAKVTVAKRLSQCLNPSLPSGVHQKALEVYNYIFTVIGKDGLSKDLPLYLPGLASTLSFASLSVRTPFLDLLERHFLDLNPRALRPAMKSIILALLPGLEEETAEDFDRTLKLMESFKVAIRPSASEDITSVHSTGDEFFWQCFFLACITSHSRRPGTLAYLVRYLPKLGPHLAPDSKRGSRANGSDQTVPSKLSQIVTSPEPGLLLRCFAAGLADEQLLIQRGFLDLLVSHLPLHSNVLQSRVKETDLQLLLKSAVGVVTRRDMSLNRRLWAWLLGPEPTAGEVENGPESPTSPSSHQHTLVASRTRYFEEYGLQPLARALLAMIKESSNAGPAERARPYRICLSLMDRWEIGGLVVPEVFLPIVDSVRNYKAQAASKAEFVEVLRSASVFFDGVESGLIYSEILGQMAQAIGPGDAAVSDRLDKLTLVKFILTHFNVREEEMVTVHAPLTVLGILCMLDGLRDREATISTSQDDKLTATALGIVADLLELVPERAFPSPSKNKSSPATESKILAGLPSLEVLKKIKTFYVNEQGNLDALNPPFAAHDVAELLLQKACTLSCESFTATGSARDIGTKSRILMLLLSKTPQQASFDAGPLLISLRKCLTQRPSIPFVTFSSALFVSTHLFSTNHISYADLTELVTPLVQHAWSFLSASEPKYHVETVRNLWHLQTALSPQSRDVEAAISSIVIEGDRNGAFAARPAEAGRSFNVLWTHTLQDNPTGSAKGAPKTPNADLKIFPRLSGMDNYDLMLTRPLFLMLDSLLDERTQLFMSVKTWLNSLVGVDKLFLIFVLKFVELEFLHVEPKLGEAAALGEPAEFSEQDDLDLALYYLRTLSNVFRWAPDAIWGVLATRAISIEHHPSLARITGGESDVTFQRFFLQICMRCITSSRHPEDVEVKTRANQLARTALTVLHQILLSPYPEPLASLHLEDILIDRLVQALHGPDPYVQVLLLDVVFASLKLREMIPVELPSSPSREKRAMSIDPSKSVRLSLSGESSTPNHPPPPASLVKCLQAGLASPNSRPVLESWISFLTECLPFYTDSIFQVLIPLVETLCAEISRTFTTLQQTFMDAESNSAEVASAPESTLISLLNGLEQVLAKSHERLLAEEARAHVVKSPDQQQSFFGNMVSGVFATDAPQSRSATANDRLTVLLAFQDAVRICFTIWSWGQGSVAAVQDATSAASFTYTSLRMRNRARRLLEHLFAAETLHCLETVIEIWRNALASPDSSRYTEVFNLLPALDGSRPKHTIPAIFNAIYSRTNPAALDPSRKSSLTVELQDTDIAIFLVDYARSLEDDAMDEIWQDCLTFLRDLLGNPFPHRQTLPSLLEFAAILGEKVDNTNFGEQRKMRRELSDLFLRLLTALFTTRPMGFTDVSNSQTEKGNADLTVAPLSTLRNPQERADDVVGILSSIVPNLPKILVEPDRVLNAATAISTNVIGPALRSKSFPDTVSKTTLVLLQELSRLPNNQKTWKKDVTDAFNDTRFFGSDVSLVQSEWLPLLKQWTLSDKERMPEILSRITPPTTAGIVFGVGATSARLEADRKTQLNLRRTATLILASADDTFVTDIPTILDKLVELLGATSTSSPSSTTRAELFMVVRALVLKTTPIHLAPLWPVVNAELHSAISSVASPDHSAAFDTYNNASVLQACKLLDLLICVAPDDFQLHEWLFVTDTIDAVYRSAIYQPVALADELSEVLGSVMGVSAVQTEPAVAIATSSSHKRPLLGPGGISDEVSLERREELVAKVLRPFFSQLSIFAFESTYAMGPVDWESCIQGLLKDLFDERSIVKAL
ncbi:Protein dopey [Pleurostoma richardsiae]|uniref:Protein dopey n=1 Tax=Pleurostoma richardsiae TaxID=41990 RepID=A0AA38SF24_9PEZI|nr:Protein dopey [Pleurostoma richardsiae]